MRARAGGRLKYVVDVHGTRIEVALDDRGVRVGDVEVAAHLADVEGTPVKLVTLGDTVHRVVVQRGATRGSYVLWIDGWRFSVDALDERTRAIRELSAASAGAKGPAPLVAPMPGLVVRVLAVEGAEVAVSVQQQLGASTLLASLPSAKESHHGEPT